MVGKFVSYLRASGYSERTTKDHLSVITCLSQRYPNIESLDVNQIRLFLSNPTWMPATRLIRWKAIKAFYSFLVHDGYRLDDPVDLIPRPKAGLARKPPMYTDSDLITLLSACRHDWLGLRDRTILMLLWTTPARVGELCRLRVSDIDMEGRRLRFVGKGGKIYKAVLWDDCAEIMLDYIQARPFASESLLVSQRGELLIPNALRQVLNRIAKRSGINKKLYPHAFRHNFGMRTVGWGLALDVAQHVMGHTSTKSTEIYRQWVTEDNALEEIDNIAKRRERIAG